MRLTKVRITDFQSVLDSTEFEIGDVMCLVGKNEAGKTALLKALYRLNPIITNDGTFDSTEDYPRRSVSEYVDDVEAGHIEPAQVVTATYELESEDIIAVQNVFGSECLRDKTPTVTLTKGYSNECRFRGLCVDDEATVKHLIESVGLPQPLTEQMRVLASVEEMVQALEDAEQMEAVNELLPTLHEISKNGVSHTVYTRLLYDRIPKFLYFDEYFQMKGQDNVEALRVRLAQSALEDSDHPLLGLLDLARLDLDQLADPRRTETLLAKLEAAENRLTQTALNFWSQNRHLRMTFDIRPAQPEDPEGMRKGMNILGRVRDTKHMVSTPLRTRSRGFVWFFSFLAWYSQLRLKGENLILLLDEPGLSLHARAQADLLHYFDEELRPNHQLIYTTHSPFMVDPRHFDRVRIVQDLSIDSESDDLPDEQQGTKVIKDVLEATSDSLFPLQGALGYEIHQSLFIGPNCLIVEGASDLLYIQSISSLLQEKGKAGLSKDWTITPVGGSGNVPAFVALVGAQKDLMVAVLIDIQKRDQQIIGNLYKSKLLRKSHVLTYADFIKGSEADIEDMFDTDFYLELVNSEFGSCLSQTHLSGKHPRILRRIEGYLEKSSLPNNAVFNHYRPARYFTENVSSLGDSLSEDSLERFQQAFTALNDLL